MLSRYNITISNEELVSDGFFDSFDREMIVVCEPGEIVDHV